MSWSSERGGLLALGDCNTLGVGDCLGNSYPERVAKRLGVAVKNCGYTMATTREGIRLLKDSLSDDHQLVLVQFGLVDSYRSLVGLPYVLYYPDNFLRKQARSIVKKIRKMSRGKIGRSLFQQGHVTPLDLYTENIEDIVHKSAQRLVVLIETVPHKEEERNPFIQIYNARLKDIANRFENCLLVQTFDEIYNHFQEQFYVDAAHLNGIGHDWLSEKIVSAVVRKNEKVAK